MQRRAAAEREEIAVTSASFEEGRRSGVDLHDSPRDAAQLRQIGHVFGPAAHTANHAVVQRVGKIVEDFMSGGARLYQPEAKTSKAAYYCHGVYGKQIKPIGGVSLGYLAPHGSTTSTNPSAVGLAPTHAPDVDKEGQWQSYNLTKESKAASDDAWLRLADEAKRAVAWVQGATTTEAIVAALADAGYTDILAVHCREVQGGENVDWDPVANKKVEHEGLGWPIDRATMNGWFDPILFSTVDAKTVIEKGDRFYSEEKKKSYEVLNPDEKGQVRVKEVPNE